MLSSAIGLDRGRSCNFLRCTGSSGTPDWPRSMLGCRLVGRLCLAEDSDMSSGFWQSIWNIFDLELVLESGSHLISSLPPANTLLGPMTMGAPLLILPNCDRSTAFGLGGGRGTGPPETTQPSASGPNSRLCQPLRQEPPRDRVLLIQNHHHAWDWGPHAGELGTSEGRY